jgi:hypothetical protein
MYRSFCEGHEKDCKFFPVYDTEFPRISDAKIKVVLLVGFEIEEVINHMNFDEFIEGSEKTEWETFRFEVDKFLAETKREIRQ